MAPLDEVLSTTTETLNHGARIRIEVPLTNVFTQQKTAIRTVTHRPCLCFHPPLCPSSSPVPDLRPLVETANDLNLFLPLLGPCSDLTIHNAKSDRKFIRTQTPEVATCDETEVFSMSASFPDNGVSATMLGTGLEAVFKFSNHGTREETGPGTITPLSGLSLQTSSLDDPEWMACGMRRDIFFPEQSDSGSNIYEASLTASGERT